MEIFNIGIPELILILLIMLIVLGPDQSIAQMKNLARFISRVVHSPLWADIINTSREIKDLPTKMIRESGLDDELNEINHQVRSTRNLIHPAEGSDAKAGTLKAQKHNPNADIDPKTIHPS